VERSGSEAKVRNVTPGSGAAGNYHRGGRRRLSLPQFTLLRPRTLQEAVGALAKHASYIRVLAGGTDLIPSMRQKLFEPEYVLDIRHLPN